MLFILRFAELQSAEELERLTVDEKLQPVERAVYLLRSVSICFDILQQTKLYRGRTNNQK